MYGPAALIAVAAVLILLGITATCLRFYVRLRLLPDHIGIDDWLILVSCVLMVGQVINQIFLGVALGEIGRDTEATIPERVAYQGRIDQATLVIEKVTYATFKLSILFFYRRLFVAERMFRIANNALIGIILLWGLLFLIISPSICGIDSNAGHPCAQSVWLLLWFGITDILGDIAILSLPYPCVRGLQIDVKQKRCLAGVFALGFLSLLSGIIRMGYVAENFRIYFHPAIRVTSDGRTPPAIWTTIEVSIGVLAASLPSLWPLIRRTPKPQRAYHQIRSGLSGGSSGGGAAGGKRAESVESSGSESDGRWKRVDEGKAEDGRATRRGELEGFPLDTV